MSVNVTGFHMEKESEDILRVCPHMQTLTRTHKHTHTHTHTRTHTHARTQTHRHALLLLEPSVLCLRVIDICEVQGYFGLLYLKSCTSECGLPPQEVQSSGEASH